MKIINNEDIISHFGILGQKWGLRRYQYPDGRFTEEGKERYFGKNAESEGYINRNKDGSYSATLKGAQKIIKDIDSVNSNILNKLTGIDPAKKLELIETGNELVYRQLKRIKEYTIEDIEKGTKNIISKPEYTKGYEDLASKITSHEDALSPKNKDRLIRMNFDREEAEGFRFKDVPTDKLRIQKYKNGWNKISKINN